MKLNIFNSWKSLGKMYGKELEFQTSRVPDKDLFVTYIRDKKSGNTVTRAYGKTREASLEATIRQLKTHDGDTVWNAIETGEPILAAAMPNKTPEKKVEWRDGVNHRHKAQKRIVGEKVEEDTKGRPESDRNPVAKNAHKFNKSVIFQDKKKTYNRKRSKEEIRKQTQEDIRKNSNVII